MKREETGGIDAALRQMPYGVHVVTLRGPQGDHGLTASWVMQVSKTPPMVAVALKKGSTSARALEASGAFAVNLLSSEDVEVAERFFTPVDRFGAPPQPTVSRGSLQTPLLGQAMGWVECRILEKTETGDHILFVGEVVGGDLKQTGLPLITTTAGLGYGGTSGGG